MKRELASLLGLQSQCGGRTRSEKSQTQNEAANCDEVPENEGNKRRKSLNYESEVNYSGDPLGGTKSRWDGVIQYSRNKRVKVLEEPKEDEGMVIVEDPKDEESSTFEENRNDRSSTIEENRNDTALADASSDENEHAIVAESKCSNLVVPICEEETRSQFPTSLVKEEESNDGSVKLPIEEVINEESREIENVPKDTILRRFTRSALKPKANTDESLESENNCSDSDPIEADLKTNDGVKALRNPKKLEMKMSKKITLNKVPSTIKDLLETGMLEGYPVTYNGGKKSYRLQGTIKGNGILCSCSLCKGCRVVTLSQFELHACRTYRHASKYIHLDNGRTLHEVLHASKNAPLDTLEATIQSAIGSLPSAQAAKVEQHGSKGKKLQTSPIHMTGKRVRSSKPVPFKKSFGNALSNTSKIKSHWKLTKKDQRLHKLVFEEGGLPDGTEVAYYAGGKKLLEGYKKGFGIFCWCCNSEVSASQFEAHAGWASRKKPYSYIYLSNGVSLHELAISLSKGRKYSAKDNDDLCSICGDGGNLLLCDGCPRAFHRECSSLPSIPRGDWYCTYCENMFQREKFVEHNANAVAAGRVSGVDPIEQITQRCIRIVNPDAEVSACVLCRGHDFCKSSFGPRTIILCDQCEKEFHVGCLKDHKMQDLKELPRGKWFCCLECIRIHSALQKLLVRGEEKLPDSLLNFMKKKHEKRGLVSIANYNVKWRLLSGKFASSESRLLLSEAVAIFHDRFDPILDSVTGRDLIPCMVYGRKIRGQDFSGMYCAVLTVDSHVVSAGIIRVLGQEVAELPLVATSTENQGKGYFQILFSCIEKLLSFLNVRSFVLPAAAEAESIWTTKFGFCEIPPEQLTDYRKNFYQMISFRGTSMLQKMVPGCRKIAQKQ